MTLGLPATETGSAVARAVAAVRARTTLVPEVAVILGTGLGALAGAMTVEVAIPYADIPGFPTATADTHEGRLLLGRLAGRAVVVMQGRLHGYEGYSAQAVSFPVRLLQGIGASILIVSNASGGLHPEWAAGEIVVLVDHLNLQGANPLIGPHDASLGARFPDMSDPYDPGLRATAREVAASQGLTLREGVYVAVAGPSFETPAEARLLRTLGADLVGMSTVPEVIVARHGGMRVLGLSIITNVLRPDAPVSADIDEVIAVARAAESRLTALVQGVLERAA